MVLPDFWTCLGRLGSKTPNITLYNGSNTQEAKASFCNVGVAVIFCLNPMHFVSLVQTHLKLSIKSQTK
jgi:hypothetical protein